MANYEQNNGKSCQRKKERNRLMTKTKTAKLNQVFSFNAPAAMSVMLVGDFTRWQEKPISLKQEQNGVWKTTVPLAPGTYHYRFLVDGEWRDDPECTLRVPNPYGAQDSVRMVPQP
ncbi:MAG TPA: isoamylase early set domain-containing protein, partial [Candidatus Eisenbacteria bacterium]|nr:isoamylase early set domain-containing protein [Candidatus Eisenbacteria bacterium]